MLRVLSGPRPNLPVQKMTYLTPKAQRPRRFRTGRTVTALMLREMSTTYGRTSLGYLWALMEPSAGILLLTLVFSVIATTPPIGTSYALFYASGILPYMMYLDISNKVGQSLRFSQALLFYPGVTFIDAILARLLLNGLTETLVFFIIIAGVIWAAGVDTMMDYPAILLGLAMTMALALGIGTINCFLLSMFPTWERTWAILNRPLVIVSCVLFPFALVPQPYQDYLWFNPLVHAVGQVRAGVYPTYDASYVSPMYIFGLSGALFALGLVLLRRYQSYIINEL